MLARARDPASVMCKLVESNDPGIQKFEWDIVLTQVLCTDTDLTIIK
jgi:hypothetical protein